MTVLIDGIGSGYFVSAPYRRLRRNGVKVRRFMHSALPWRMPFLNLRTHKKILVVDGRVAFTGGMNLAAENLVALAPRHPVRDLHFRVAGPVVAQLTTAFLEDWQFVAGEDPDDAPWFPSLAEAGPAVARVVTSGPDQDLEKIEFIIMEAIACARQTIHVATPYFLPDERLVTALNLAALRGVRVDIVMPARSNHRMVDWAARANAGPLLAGGCRIWLGPPPFDHSKIMVVDGSWCLIGSSNWDMRSFRLNFELCMEVYHDGLATTLESIVANAMHQQLTVADLDARSLPTRLRDAGVRLMLPYL
jgi:cardiolipin synthase